MKIARFIHQGRSAYGVVLQDAFIAEPSSGFLARHPDMAAVFAQDATEALSQDVAGRTTGLPLGDVQLLAPLSAHNKIICVGINYRKKYPVEGVAPPDPDHIILFAKHHDAIVGQGKALELPQGDAAQTFDYEGEITLVVGKAGRHITRETAMSHVAGYTILNDGSVRGWQKHSLHAGKNFANSGGCGPWIVSVRRWHLECDRSFWDARVHLICWRTRAYYFQSFHRGRRGAAQAPQAQFRVQGAGRCGL